MGDYWKDNNLEKPQQVIVCAACKWNDVIICGARHWDSVMRKQFSYISMIEETTAPNWIQGFIDQFGEFLTREEAASVAFVSKQANTNCLYSEDLY